MVKLGQTTSGKNHGCKYLWLVKNMQVFRNYDKKACYEVLAFNGAGWFVLYSGTLVDCRKFIGNEEIIESIEEYSKHYDDYTSEEDCKENAECAKGNDVFDGCKMTDETEKEESTINDIKGHIYVDTDSVKVAPLSEQQTGKRYTAISNPEWHHVSLATLANIDFDMLDEKRKVYLSFLQKWREVRKNLRKCSCGSIYERCYNVFRGSLITHLAEKKISKALVEYFDRQVSMVNVECGVWSSAVEVATGEHYSRKYNRQTLRY